MIEYRGYNIKNENSYLMKVIEYPGRGSVHMSLRGLYTNDRMAKKAIDYYENNKEEMEKEVASVKTIIRRRGKQV